MNTTLSTTQSRHYHPPEQSSEQGHYVRRVGLLDTLALHLGVALIKWGGRPRAVESRERRASRVELHLARIESERAAERAYRLTVPFR